MSFRSVSRYLWLVSFFTALALFGYLVKRTGVGTVLGQIRLLGWGFAILIFLSGARHLLRTLAWYGCLELRDPRVNLWQLLRIRLVTEAVTDLTPAGPLAGESARFWAASRYLPVTGSLSSILLEKLTYTFSAGLFVLSGLGLWLLKLALPARSEFAAPRWALFC